MGMGRLQGIDPGRLGVFAGALAGQPAAVQREVVAEIERLGYGTLWYGEAMGREAFSEGAIFLAATAQLVVASGIANIWARDATAMVAGGWALAEAWPGRFILGIGVSHAPMVARRGHSYERPVASMREYLDAMDEVTWRGPEVVTPPVVLAALGPRMTALAGERAAGTYPYFSTDDHVREQRVQLGSEPFIASDLPVVLASDRAAARAIGNRHLAVYLRTANYVNNLLRLGWLAEDLEAPGSERLFDAIVAWGQLGAIEVRVRARFEAGADQVALNLITSDPGVPYLDELRTLAPLVKALA
jgi:probable F420-dependent oxidoreductase